MNATTNLYALPTYTTVHLIPQAGDEHLIFIRLPDGWCRLDHITDQLLHSSYLDSLRLHLHADVKVTAPNAHAEADAYRAHALAEVHAHAQTRLDLQAAERRAEALAAKVAEYEAAIVAAAHELDKTTAALTETRRSAGYWQARAWMAEATEPVEHSVNYVDPWAEEFPADRPRLLAVVPE